MKTKILADFQIYISESLSYQKGISPTDVFLILQRSGSVRLRRKWFSGQNKERKTTLLRNARNTTRYLNIFNFINILTLMSTDAKSAILLRVLSLTKNVEARNFPLLHFPRCFCLVNGQLATSLRRVKRPVIWEIPMFLSLRCSTIVSFILSTTFYITEIPP